MTKQDQKDLAYVLDRRQKMDQKRARHESVWDKIDKNFYYTPALDGSNKDFGTSIPYEQLLIEAYMWSLPEWLPIKVVNKKGKVDGKQLLLASHTLQHFMERENSVVEIDTFDKKKARYGTWWLFSWMYFDSRLRDKELSTEWHIWVFWDIDIRKVWIDDRAKSYFKAMDEILQEDISIEEFKLRYTDQKGYKYVNSVGVHNSKGNREVTQEVTDDGRNVQLWHYWNIYDGTYRIVANESILIYNGKMEEEHGWLPLIPVQHYPDSESIYGIGIPQRFAFCKPYINQLLNYALDGAKLNAWYNVFTSSGTEIDGELYSEPWQGTIVTYTWDYRGIQPFQPNVNVWQLAQILSIMEDFGTQAIWFDPRTSYKAQSDKVGIAALLKEEQSQRARPVARSRNFWLWHAFTIMLLNIASFAPYKYAELVFDNDGQVEDYDWYTIEIKNKKIEMNDKGEVIDVKDTPWEDDEYALVDSKLYWGDSKERLRRFGNFFDMSDDQIYKWAGLKVQIDTPSSVSSMKSIDKADLKETIAALAMQFQNTQDQELLPILKKMNSRLYELYDIDPDNIDIASKADERRAFIAQAETAIGNFNSPLSQPIQDVQQSANWWAGVQAPQIAWWVPA